MHRIDHRALNLFLPTHPPNFKKLDIEHDFLNKEECISLTKYITNHSLLNKSLLGSKAFSSSYSFHIHFNKYSKQDFLNYKHDLKPIYDIFEKIKHPDTNAYVFNPLVLNGLNVLNLDPKLNSVGYHYDDTLFIRDNMKKLYLPICTTVLYIDVPKIFVGGILQMHDFGFIGDHCSATFKIRPEVGKKIVFRGDMCHSVSPMYSNEDTKRVSLVFEQYNIPENRLNEASFKVVSSSQS